MSLLDLSSLYSDASKMSFTSEDSTPGGRRTKCGRRMDSTSSLSWASSIPPYLSVSLAAIWAFISSNLRLRIVSSSVRCRLGSSSRLEGGARGGTTGNSCMARRLPICLWSPVALRATVANPPSSASSEYQEAFHIRACKKEQYAQALKEYQMPWRMKSQTG